MRWADTAREASRLNGEASLPVGPASSVRCVRVLDVLRFASRGLQEPPALRRRGFGPGTNRTAERGRRSEGPGRASLRVAAKQFGN